MTNKQRRESGVPRTSAVGGSSVLDKRADGRHVLEVLFVVCNERMHVCVWQ
jgi:hypothetical protein